MVHDRVECVGSIVDAMDRTRWVNDTWAAISRGDIRSLADALAPDAQWRAVYDGPWNCRNKAMILTTMSDQITNGLSGQIEEIVDQGDRIIVGFRPDDANLDSWPLDHGVRYLVVTLRGESVTELKGCTDRRSALDYAATG